MGMGRGGGGAMPAVVSRKRYLGAINSPPSALKLVFLCFVEVFARICSVLKLWMIISFNDHTNLFSRSPSYFYFSLVAAEASIQKLLSTPPSIRYPWEGDT